MVAAQESTVSGKDTIMSNASINWQQGQLVTLNPGDTASCTGGLNQGQLYCLFFYNVAGNDAGANVSVIWSNGQPPVPVHVPGTTGNQGLAALCFVNGDQTNSVSAAVLQNQPGVQLQAFIGSVKMPVNTTGINNLPLPLDGQNHAFTKFTRYYAVPASHYYQAQIRSDINQFISVQFAEKSAVVNVVNSLVSPGTQIFYAGNSQPLVTVSTSSYQTISWPLQGNGQQLVWINADSVQNSQSATISVQSLSAQYERLGH
jgi:hypothetical protein